MHAPLRLPADLALCLGHLSRGTESQSRLEGSVPLAASRDVTRLTSYRFRHFRERIGLYSPPTAVCSAQESVLQSGPMLLPVRYLLHPYASWRNRRCSFAGAAQLR